MFQVSLFDSPLHLYTFVFTLIESLCICFILFLKFCMEASPEDSKEAVALLFSNFKLAKSPRTK